MRGKLLIQTANNTVFDPVRTAKSITPLLLELSNDAVFAINADLDALLGSDTAGLRSAAIALKVRSGSPLGGLAKRDPSALLDAVAALSIEQAPASLPDTLIDLAESGQVNPGLALVQADRLTDDKPALFERLAKLADPAMDASYEQWGAPHKLAMAALAGMHATPDEDWPEGFESYRFARTDEATLKLGKEIYFKHDQGCYKCHGPNGEGAGGFPPIAGSPTLLGDPLRAAAIVKYGLEGELAHTLNPADGNPFNTRMEPLSQFNDAELAAVLSYVRQSFGNFAPPVTMQQVAATKKPEDGALAWDFASLLKDYPFERDRLTGPLPAPSINIQHWAPPAAGLWLMLAVVTLCMLLILGITYAGKFMQPIHSIHTPAH